MTVLIVIGAIWFCVGAAIVMPFCIEMDDPWAGLTVAVLWPYFLAIKIVVYTIRLTKAMLQ